MVPIDLVYLIPFANAYCICSLLCYLFLRYQFVIPILCRTTLARWRAAHLDIVKEQERRPYLATECNDVDKAEKFRRQIIGEVSKKVSQIQNAGLGEFKLRDLNDEINKLLREKGHWEDQIKVLGGPDYRKIGPKMLDHEGKEVPGNKGYKYFGAARDLPGVRELFQQAPPPPSRKTRAELMKNINADYYGYRDEDDGVLCLIEQEKEKNLIAEKIEEWREQRETDVDGEITKTGDDDNSGTADITDESDERLEEMKKKVLRHFQPFVAHVPVPSQKEVEAALLERKKEQLRQRYISEALLQETEETKKLSLPVN